MQPSSLARRKDIHALENAMLSMEETIDLDALTFHHFCPGVYVRELRIPKGFVVTGKIHKTEHLTIMVSGSLAVVTESKEEVIYAPSIFATQPGTKRAVVALEDTIIMTVHPTEETDLEKIEDQVIAKDYDDPVLIEYQEKLS